MALIRIACPLYASAALSAMGYSEPHSLGIAGRMPKERIEWMQDECLAARADVLVTEEVAQRIRERVARDRALLQAELDALLARPKEERPFGRVYDLRLWLGREEPEPDPAGSIQTAPQWLDIEPEDVHAGRIRKRPSRPPQWPTMEWIRA